MEAASDRLLGRWWPALCALAAYLPALASSPGRMPADTKLGLYLDPVRLTAGATETFDPSLYAGWVPHQQIAYLWPSGPWYSTFEVLGVPDWIAHRLWIGTLLFAAGTGVGWTLRHLRYAPMAVAAGALVYQLSPYVLPYVSRTSALLLPFAGLGWIAGATLLATRDRSRVPWRWPAVIALVVATIGAVNATALLMIVPAPVLVLVHARRAERAPWRRLALVATVTTACCTLVSLWWVAMLVTQAEHGPDVLAYSESLRAVSTSATAIESLRGLGYWLFYVRDHVGATTTASIDHLDDPAVVAAGAAVVGLALLGMVVASDARARLGAWSVAVGTVVAVGVHPIDDPSPLVRLLGGDLEGGLALALRSSARAVPVVLFGLAIGAAGLVERSPWPARLTTRLGHRTRLVTAAAIVLLAVVATPSWWTASLVDPNLDRDQEPPAAWSDAIDRLDRDETLPEGGIGRTLQVPGAEFGAFDWGVTVDQPLSSLADRPVVTRDLLPLGSPAAMDLVFALDDRMQDGVLEAGSIAPVARWLGVDRIWLAGDLDVERYATARPGVVQRALDESGSLERIDALGEPSIAGASVVDEELLGVAAASAPIEPVVLYEPVDATGIVRVRTDEVVLVGSGDGLVDAAAAGVLDGRELVVNAVDEQVDEPVSHLVVTDSHRRRAHHWRSSQDVHGATEAAGEAPPDDDGDERLPIFDGATERAITDDDRTVSEQFGRVAASASSYGELFAYLPEHRAVMAVDGDAGTAWTVGEHADPIGERLELRFDAPNGPVSTAALRQARGPADDRTITEVRVQVDDHEPYPVVLDERSHAATGQPVVLDPPATSQVVIEIAAVSGGRTNAVGFAEVDLGLGPTQEWIRTPTEVPAVDPDGVLDVVVTRLRAEATDRWRDDPEPTIRRTVTLPDGAERLSTPQPELTIRLDPRATDERLVELVGGRAVADAHLLGSPASRGDAAVDGDPATQWTTPFRSPVGPGLRFPGADGTTDRITVVQPDGPYSPITSLRVTDADGVQIAELDADGVATLGRPVDAATLTISVETVEERTTVDRRFGDVVLLPAAVAELDLGADVVLGPPPTERVRADCESGWWQVDGAETTISFDADAGDLLSGAAITATACDSLPRPAEQLLIESTPPPGFQIDRVALRFGAADDGLDADPGPLWSTTDSADPRRVTIESCPDGCWVVLGHGFNPAWEARLDGVRLAGPRLVDGNANGWWLAPFTEPVVVDLAWTAQTPVDVAVIVSALAIVGLLVGLAITDRRRRRTPDDAVDPSEPVAEPASEAPGSVVAVGYVVAATLLVGPVAGGMAALVAGVVALGRRRRPVGSLARAVSLLAVTGVAIALAWVVAVVAVDAPPADLAWPSRFESGHRPVLFLLITLVAGLEATLVPTGPTSRISTAPGGDPGDRP